MNYRKILALLGTLLSICLFLGVAGPMVQSASADDPVEIEVPETPEGSLPPDRSARPVLPRACGTSTSIQRAKTVTVSDSEGGDDVWTFRNKVWYDRCANVTIIRSVTSSYGVNTGTSSPCRNWSFVDKIRVNSGDLDGWNVPAVTWDCGNTQPSATRNFDAPNGTQIFCTNDNLIGMKATAIRGPAQIDSVIDVPALRVPRPTDC